MMSADAAMAPVLVNNCAGWLHAPTGQTHDVAVLLCPGVGQDYTNGYRPLRILANRLAQEGYPVLRFDYPGTGDSGEPENDELWSAWRTSVHEAANWLRRASGARRLVLAGLRVGAALAALEAGQRDDVAALILFEPFLQMRSFVLQATAESRFRKTAQGRPEAADKAGLEIGELKFSAADLREMRETDLTALSFRTRMPAIIFSRKDGTKLVERLGHWERQGVAASCRGFDDFTALLRPNQHSGEPELDSRALLDWMNEEIRPGVTAGDLAAAPGTLQSQHWQERVIRFGGGLAGVLCRPKGEITLTLLICNSGGNPRQGFARFSVALARRLAAAGIASFRFDFAGLGDSIHLEGGVDTQSDVFMQDRTEDFSAALDALEALGLRRFAVHGLCAGAYHAVQAAYRDPRIDMLAVINLPWFTLRHETPGPDSTVQRIVTAFRSRNLRALFMFSSADAGLKQFERHFGPAGDALQQIPGMNICISDAFDHELTESWMQDLAIRETAGFLERHFWPRAAASPICQTL